tara:strand:+ start:13368 stop:14213 length:846 start_codon:yes stop_codon:yes gene_type:complete
MKYERLPTRRKPVRKTLSARIFNKTKTKRQRASAAAASPEDMEESGINISRSLTIIFAIHILAIGMIFVHKQYLSDRTPGPGAGAGSSGSSAAVSTPVVTRNNDLPKLSTGDTPYMLRQGDNYSIIAAKHNVDESELRNLNRGAAIRAGAVLRIPQSNRIIAEDPPEVAAIRNQPRLNYSERGLVEIVPLVASNPARVIRPVTSPVTSPVASPVTRPVTRREVENAPRANVVGSGRTHILKAGENIWRISNKYKVSQQELMALNNITDPSKLQIGQVIKLP